MQASRSPKRFNELKAEVEQLSLEHQRQQAEIGV